MHHSVILEAHCEIWTQAFFSMDGQWIGDRKVEMCFLTAFPDQDIIHRISEQSGCRALLKQRASTPKAIPGNVPEKKPDKTDLDSAAVSVMPGPSAMTHYHQKAKNNGDVDRDKVCEGKEVNKVKAEGVMKGARLLGLKPQDDPPPAKPVGTAPLVNTKLKPSAKEFVALSRNPSLASSEEDSNHINGPTLPDPARPAPVTTGAMTVSFSS